MRKRKKYGYILLAGLIISGLAGTPTDHSLTEKERKFASDHLKMTKNEFYQVTNNLTKEQLNYRPVHGPWTIKETLMHISNTEKTIWEWMQSTLKTEANPFYKDSRKYSDKQLINLIYKGIHIENIIDCSTLENTHFSNLEDALTDYKNRNKVQIKYIRYSTEDLRNHLSETGLSWLDSYQICLVMSAHSLKHIREIRQIKNEPGFPGHSTAD